MNVTDLSAIELRNLILERKLTCREVVETFLENISRLDGQIGAFIRVRSEQAIREAEAVDQKLRNGHPVGPLAGLPVAVKDILCMRGEPTTCASKMLAEFRPPYDATVVEKIKAADGIIIGKTNMDEFAMGSSTETSAFGLTRNPWDLERIPGGSSGGAAACVAARMVPLSIGTDTGGSIRQPAALCGVTGLKPTYGRVSRWGLIAYASSLDQVGPIAQSVEDVALLLEVIAGHDARDSTSVDRPVPKYSQLLKQQVSGLRIGLVKEHFNQGLDPEVEKAVHEAVRVFRSLGASVCEVSLPHSKYAVATYYIVAPSEASSNLARYDGVHYGYRTDERKMYEELLAERRRLEEANNKSALDELDSPIVRLFRKTRSEGFGPEVKRRIMLGTYALSAGYYDAYYLKALKVRRLIKQDFDATFEKVDILLGPVTPTAAFKLGEKIDDPLAMYLFDLYTVATNLAGICGISVPCGFTNIGLPIGLHLQAPAFAEEKLLQAAYMYQQVTDWHTRKPAIAAQ